MVRISGCEQCVCFFESCTGTENVRLACRVQTKPSVLHLTHGSVLAAFIAHADKVQHNQHTSDAHNKVLQYYSTTHIFFIETFPLKFRETNIFQIIFGPLFNSAFHYSCSGYVNCETRQAITLFFQFSFPFYTCFSS